MRFVDAMKVSKIAKGKRAKSSVFRGRKAEGAIAKSEGAIAKSEGAIAEGAIVERSRKERWAKGQEGNGVVFLFFSFEKQEGPGRKTAAKSGKNTV